MHGYNPSFDLDSDLRGCNPGKKHARMVALLRFSMLISFLLQCSCFGTMLPIFYGFSYQTKQTGLGSVTNDAFLLKARMMKIWNGAKTSNERTQRANGRVGMDLRLSGRGLFHFQELYSSDLSGIRLFESFKNFINSQFSDELSVIAGSVLHDEFKKDILNDESKVLTKVEIQAVDARGVELEVVICSSSVCWLKLVHVPFPIMCRDANSLLSAFESLFDSALAGKMGIHIASDYEVLPEFLSAAVKLMNSNFVEYLKETVNKLGGAGGTENEYIKSVLVTSLDEEGFDCEADLCNQQECHHLWFRVKFPRKARSTQDLQAEIVDCLEEGVCTIDWTTVHS
jgi:hypothetical protein